MMKMNTEFEPIIIPFEQEEEELDIWYDEDLEEINIGEIKSNSYKKFRSIFLPLVSTQLALNEAYRQPIEIYISSVGGDVLQGFNIINEIQAAQNKGIEVVTIAGDFVASMGLAIYMVGSQRICNRYSEFMFHQIRGGGSSNEVRHQEVVLERTSLYWETVKGLTKDYTKITDEFLNMIYKEKVDYYFFGEEAIELGFADIINE